MTRTLPCLAVLALAGCATPTVAVVAGYETINGHASLRRCRVHYEWTQDQLRSYCGEPVVWLSHNGSEQWCAIYRTIAVPWHDEPAPPYIAVCMDEGVINSHVADIIGLSEGPSISANDR